MTHDEYAWMNQRAANQGLLGSLGGLTYATSGGSLSQLDWSMMQNMNQMFNQRPAIPLPPTPKTHYLPPDDSTPNQAWLDRRVDEIRFKL